jgi:glutamate carboxypeptidase
MTGTPLQRVHAWLREREDEMLALLEPLVLAESPSADPAAQDLVFAILSPHFRRLGWRSLRLAGELTGGSLLTRPRTHGPSQLVVAHVDTVWPHGTLAAQPFRVVGDRVYGPGTFDTKAGVVQLLCALRAMQALDLHPRLAPVVFLNSDEEIGSPESCRHLVRLARGARRAWVLEPSLGPGGALKTARRGVARFVVDIGGRAAHAGLEPLAGVSATHELPRVIDGALALADPGAGILVNIGQVEGGTRPNVVAAAARVVIDVRVATEVQAVSVEAGLHALRPVNPAATITVSGGFLRPPMARDDRTASLFATARDLAAELGFALDEATAGGGSDGNTTHRFTPTLDGLGAVGDGAHAAHEHVRISEMPRRAALLAGLLLSAD